MGNKIIFEYKNQYFDSQEEIWFAKWCEELKNAGYVLEWLKGNTISMTPGLKLDYVKKTQLKTKVKRELKHITLLEESEYTPDFKIIWTNKGLELFFGEIPHYPNMFTGNPNSVLFGENKVSYVEVKPVWDSQNMTRVFVTKQKFLWLNQRLFVNLIKPEDLFKKTFMPAEAVSDFKLKKTSVKGKNKGKQAGDWKVNYIPKTLNDFLNGTT